MWNNIRITVLVIAVLVTVITGCSEESTSSGTYQESESQSVVSASAGEADSATEGDVRIINEVQLTNVSQQKAVGTYKLGDKFQELIISELKCEQRYNGVEWEDKTIQVAFGQEMALDATVVYQDGSVTDVLIDKESYDQVPVLPGKHTAENLSINLRGDSLDEKLLELAQNERGVPDELAALPGRISIPIVLTVNDYTVSLNEYTEMDCTAEVVAVRLPERISSTTLRFEDIENNDIDWASLVTRELEVIDVSSLDGTEISESARMGDGFLNTQITEIENIEYFFDGQWYTGRATILFTGQIELTGTLQIEWRSFIPYEPFYSAVPTFTTNPPRGYANVLFGMDEEVSARLAELYSDNIETNPQEVKDVTITFEQFGRVYFKGEGGVDNISGKVLEIKDASGKLLYATQDSDKP